MNALVPVTQQTNVDIYRASTDAAGLCRDIVLATAKVLGDRKYVQVEGWEAIALAHGCVCSSGKVEQIAEGVRAIGYVRRMSDGATIAEAEGFVGKDEPTWYGGKARRWKWGKEKGEKVWYEDELPKRADYAIRAMAQTRAISRAARSAFAHVVVMMNAGLSTTPAEEVPDGGFNDDAPASTAQDGAAKAEHGRAKAKGGATAKAAEPRQDEAKPPELSAGALAAINAIHTMKTEQALGDWGIASSSMIKAMEAPDALAVRQAYGVKLEAFRRAAEDAAAMGSGAAKDDPFSEPARDKPQDAEFEDKVETDADGDPLLKAWTREQSLKWRDDGLQAIAACNTESELRKWNDAEEVNVQSAHQSEYDAIEQAWKARAAAIREQSAGLTGRA